METFKQKVLRLLYPLIRKMAKSGKNGTVLNNREKTAPTVSLYEQRVTLSNGKTMYLSGYAGKKVLIVNTASNCGYTGQYAELQELHEKWGDKLAIIAFPSNDFKEQEKANDDKIAQFCQINYGVTFPIAQKGVVIKSEEQQPIYRWLTDSRANGWNNHQPDWNFGKYIIDKQGILTHYFGPSISPLDDEFLRALE